MSSFTLLETKAYYDTLHTEITRAKHSINITSFDLIYDQSTKTVLDAIEAAAKRGVVVTMSADTMTFNELMGRAIGPITPTHSSSQSIRDYAARIRKAGGSFTWLGKMLVVNSYKKRNHEKWSVVDDHVFTFGGINMYDAGFANTDYMLHTTDKTLADALRIEHKKIIANPDDYPGHIKSINETDTLYIDSASPRSSSIYQRACELAELSKSVLFVSQFYPTGPLGAILKKKKTTYYMNRTSLMTNFLSKGMQRFDAFRSGIVNSYTRENYLHAKCIIFTMQDGTKIALSGSHNFSYAGVKFGTVECNLETSNQKTIEQIEYFIKHSIA